MGNAITGNDAADGAAGGVTAADCAAPRRRRGRPAGTSTARADILAAARREFAEKGFDGASIRGIARAARVDPALVHHYFPDKGTLFLSTTRLAMDPRTLVVRLAATGKEGLGRRIVATALTAWESPFGASLIRAYRAEPRLVRGFGNLMGRTIRTAAAELLGADAPNLAPRTAAIETIITGMFVSRYVAAVEPTASLTREQMIDTFGPILQSVLDGRRAP